MMKWSLDDVQHEIEVFGGSGGITHEEYLDALVELRQQTSVTGRSKLGYDDEELIVTIDNIHERQYGHKYSEKLEAILTLPSLPKKLDRDWVFEDEIVSFLREQRGFPDEVSTSILKSLCLEGSAIAGEDAHPFEFSRTFRLNRRPLPKVRVGNRTAYYLSVPFLSRSFLHIQVEYHGGSHPELKGTDVGREISTLNKRYADYFVRERVYPVFKQNGFAADYHVKRIGQHDLAKECGEIDVLAFSRNRRELVIAECKHKVGKEIHVSQIREEIWDFTKPKDGFVHKLKRKVAWVENHIQDVLNHMNLDVACEGITYVPVFITNYYCPASEFISEIPFVAEPDLGAWCREHARL